MTRDLSALVFIGLTSLGPVAAAKQPPAAHGILDSLSDPRLHALVAESLDRNPDLLALRARALAAQQVPAQARALPDPMLTLTVWPRPPESRTGPDQLMLDYAQELPPRGSRKAATRAAAEDAAAAGEMLEARRLEVLTAVRRLYHELQLVSVREELLREQRDASRHAADLATARYAAGQVGQQDVLTLHAEVTRAEVELLDLEAERGMLLAALNAIRDRPSDTPVGAVSRLAPAAPAPDSAAATSRAMASRPEVTAATHEIAAAEARIAEARSARRPVVTLGATYGLVGRRMDLEGELQPPEGNGEDDVGIGATWTLPIHRRKLEALVEEATLRHQASAQDRRALEARIGGDVARLLSRMDATSRQLRLIDDVLTPQSDQALRAALSGYATGLVDGLRVLEATRTYYDARLGAERARADLAVAAAELEGAIGAPLASVVPEAPARTAASAPFPRPDVPSVRACPADDGEPFTSASIRRALP
jgi:outer membrane protein TolC